MEKVCLDIADVVRDEPIILSKKMEEQPALGACGTFPERRGLWKSEQKCQPLSVQESEL